jgi:hypothetical protein
LGRGNLGRYGSGGHQAKTRGFEYLGGHDEKPSLSDEAILHQIRMILICIKANDLYKI